jgi:drug/metabolite transporter (DMT)-like permease
VFGSRDLRAIVAIFLNPYIVGGMLCYVVSVFLWMYVLSQQPVGIVYPMMSLAYVAAVLMGVLFLGESFSALRIVGLAFVMMGVWFIARSAA